MHKRWQLVGFGGPKGAESRGIVDLLMIRRDHRTDRDDLRPGDLFEMMLVQVKGGGARWPLPDDLKRLRAVQQRYEAMAIVLSSCEKDATEPRFYQLSHTICVFRPTWATVPV